MVDPGSPPPLIPLAEDQKSLADEQVQKLPAFWRAAGVLVLLSVVTAFAGLLNRFGLDSYLDMVYPGLDENARFALVQAHWSSAFGMALFYTVQFILIMPVLHYAADFPVQPWYQTLAIRRVPLSTLGRWLGIWFISTTAVVVLMNIVEKPDEAFMSQLTANPHWLMVIATVVLAPLMEESLFRGYLFRAICNTWMGAIGAVLLTSVLFTAMHAVQYSVLALLQIFTLALVLGLARERTGSLLVPLTIHVMQNTLANVLPLFGG